MPRDGTTAANAAVVISADKNVKYESVVKVMDTLQRAGIQLGWLVGPTGELIASCSHEQRARPV